MVDFGLDFRSELTWDLLEFINFFMLGELHPLNHPIHDGLVHEGLGPPHPAPTQAQDVFGLNRPSQLVIGHHWLAFLNQVRKNH